MASERQEINIVSPWWGEHLHRYEEVIKSLSGNEIILDIACGSGFGAHLLSNHSAGRVFGGDISLGAIKLCDNSWNKENLSFQVMDGTNLKFKDNTFNVVVSFETIEHTFSFKEMIEEFKRVIKPNGIIYLSTPNIKINSPTGVVTNPYHTQEWDYKEFNRYKNKKNIAFYIENLLYKRGIRKIPVSIQDKIIKVFGQKSIYPSSKDYIMTDDIWEIKKCKTFFAICSK